VIIHQRVSGWEKVGGGGGNNTCSRKVPKNSLPGSAGGTHAAFRLDGDRAGVKEASGIGGREPDLTGHN